MRIAFHTENFDCRGTNVSIFDYAFYNRTLLNNSSIIVSPLNKKHDKDIIKKFIKVFDVYFYRDINHLIKIVKNCDVFYAIKYGRYDNLIIPNIKNVVHCVFDMTQPHGDVYAGVSRNLALKFNSNVFVPHMIGLSPSTTNENMREQLNIPENAIVFGRHGGVDTFDIAFVHYCIRTIVRVRNDIYFILVNTYVFDYHPNIIYINKIVDVDDKNKFICSCDAMIHAQYLGETFGLSIGEFSVNNKPIITYGGKVLNDNYKIILKNNAIYYHNYDELYNIFQNFDKNNYLDISINSYTEYSPTNVMKIFKEVFLD